MRKLTSFAAILLSGFIIAGCSSSSDNELDNIAPQELYSQGQAYLEDGDYNNAVRYLEAADAYARQSSYGEQVQLGLIYANYRLGEYHKALENAERFARVFPTSASMDYVYYLAGLSNARLSDNFIQDFFGVNNASRATENVRNAYGSFQTLVQRFPQSKYVQEAQHWMAYLKNRLADNELRVAKFYMERDAYVAVANRVQEMMRFYPDSKATAEALPLLQQAFEQMNIQDSAQKVAALIQENEGKEFPETTKPEYGEQF